MRLEATVTDSAQLRWWRMAFRDQIEVLEPANLGEKFVIASQSLHGIYHQKIVILRPACDTL
jgi:hypothetical protein